MTRAPRRGRQNASTPAAVATASSPLRVRRSSNRCRGILLALVSLLALAFSAGAAPALPRDFALEATAGGVFVALLGADRGCLHKAGDGILVTIGDHRIVVSPGVVRFDGVETRLDGLRRVVVDAGSWGLSVAADGRIVMKIDDLDGLEEAAGQGNAFAMNDLAVRLATGDGIARDTSRAARLYRRAAEAGLSLAAGNLAILQQTGDAPTAAVPPNSTASSSSIGGKGP